MAISRRRFLGRSGLVGAGVGAGLAAGVATSAADRPTSSAAVSTVEFFGEHQAGIATPAQEFVQFGTFDLVSDSVAGLRGLLERWSAAAALLAAGIPVGAMRTGSQPPADTGEAVGLGPSRLTVTFGLGPGVFVKDGRDRLGLAARRPAPLVDLPAFATDVLDPDICGGDLAIQVCADDPQVAFHGMHELARIAADAAVPRWVLAGFGRTGNTSDARTPRNLMGFKDGTANIVAQDHRALDRFVWARQPGSPAWMAGGSYLVARRIEIMFGAWDAAGLDAQEATFGRRKLSGAPLTGSAEHDRLDLAAERDGLPVIPADAHVRLASPEYNGGQRLLRRGYSYAAGTDAATSTLAGGQLFLCYQRDPRLAFIPIQRRLASGDALNQHSQHLGSAIFACPPGARRGDFVGAGLFA